MYFKDYYHQLVSGFKIQPFTTAIISTAILALMGNLPTMAIAELLIKNDTGTATLQDFFVEIVDTSGNSASAQHMALAAGDGILLLTQNINGFKSIKISFITPEGQQVSGNFSNADDQIHLFKNLGDPGSVLYPEKYNLVKIRILGLSDDSSDEECGNFWYGWYHYYRPSGGWHIAEDMLNLPISGPED